MISNGKDTSLNEDKDDEAKEETKGKSEEVSNTKGKNVKDGFIRKIIGKISIEPAVILMNLGWTMYWVQTSNLYIEKTCKVGSFFFGNGTTFNNEVVSNLSENTLISSKYKCVIIFSFLYNFLLRYATIFSMEPFRRSRSTCRRWWPTWRWSPT